ncbi:acylglycerol kinase family protein [Acetobacter sp. AN02]|uniref:diacylglycerol/lipid kinase family protein n=1 Tax=Acetobacter sp. AN02 TaxID=2894186 RepID=UPI0024344957|nr:diacylglycerol kinase family protein [Acetobacter sp. AN02]MDG6094250.1 acylglycerol kinase family protein [Acetobacter sp. AN02]
MSFAVVHNPCSRMNGSDGEIFRTQGREMLGDRFLSPQGREALITEVMALRDRAIDTVVIDGGDGTVSDVMTAIHAGWSGETFPDIAILPSGNTNLIAADVGFGMRGIPALECLLEKERCGLLRKRTARRHPIVLSWPETGRRDVLGMFCGLAAFTRGIGLAHQPAILDHYSHNTAVVVTLLSAFSRLLHREGRREWLDGTQLTMSRDGGAGEGGARFLFLGTTLHSLPYGVWPFWEGVPPGGALAWLEIMPHPRRLLPATLSLLSGRAPAWLRGDPAFRSGRSATITIRMDERLVIDGEELDTGPRGVVTLSEGKAITFLRS